MIHAPESPPEIARSRAIKRRNALTALITGGLLAVYSGRAYGLGEPHGLGILYGVAAGILYAQMFSNTPCIAIRCIGAAASWPDVTPCTTIQKARRRKRGT